MARAYSTTALLSKKFDLYDFDGHWLQSFGKPARGSVWIIYGDSTNGKTTFTLQLCKYLTNFGRVAYNSLESGYGAAMQEAYKNTGMEEVKSKITLLDKEPIEELIVRLKKKKSPDVIVIDSIQYSQLSYKDYIRFKDMFRHKTLIFISHYEGNQVIGSCAKRIRFDSDVKIHVDRYMAFVRGSRFGGVQEPFVIWKEKAEEYWGKEI